MKSNIILIPSMVVVLLAASCSGSTPKEPVSDKETRAEVVTIDRPTKIQAPMTRDVEFMTFLHRFTTDPDYQMAHIKFPLGKMSYAYLESKGDYDDFTSKYWILQDMESLRGYFTWKSDTKIVYLLNNSVLGEEYGAEFQDTYTFEKINGEWYVTAGDYSGSDVGLAEYTAGNASSQNKKFRKKYSSPAPEYVFEGTPGDYPEASERLLTEEDLAGKTSKELRLMRNEIMARHGYSFKSKDLKEHFEPQLWYFPLFVNVGKYLSDIEDANVKFIQSHEK